MTKLVWVTDPHLNFVDGPEFEDFVLDVLAEKAEALVVTGDIAESHLLDRELRRLYDRVGLPVYYVLGNHDFYGGSIQETRRAARLRMQRSPHLVWVRDRVIPLNATWGLVGVDGWGDGRLGNYAASPIELNDQRHIAEFKAVQAALRYREKLLLCQRLGTEEAEALRGPLAEALASFPNVLVLTHVPPFAEAAWHEGEQSDPNWLPWFTCKAVGDVLVEAADAHPHRTIRVLCGHTHGAGRYQARPNLEVLTGEADYRFAVACGLEC